MSESETEQPPDLTAWTQAVVREQSAQKRIGRPPLNPSAYDVQAVETMLNHIRCGMSVTGACREPGTPTSDAVFIRMGSDESFSATIAAAREKQQEVWMDRIVDIAMDATPENWQVAKLAINTMQWTAGRLLPKKYGDRTELNVNITHGLADRLNAAIARQTEKLIEGKAEPEDTDSTE